MPKPKLADIAARIDAHFEHWGFDRRCVASNTRVLVTYGRTERYWLSFGEAECYLAYLDAGGTGKHWKACGCGLRHTAQKGGGE